MDRHRTRRRIVFIATPHSDPWSGAEELWAQAALELVKEGFAVSASLTKLQPMHRRVAELEQRGVELWLRPVWYSLPEHPLRRLMSISTEPAFFEVKRLLSSRRPSLAVFSEGNALPPIDMLELCAEEDIPFVTITQANKEAVWYADRLAARYRAALAAAKRCFFVSHANRILSEKQIGGSYNNAEIVWNPVNIDREVSLPWPSLSDSDELRFACVGRLYPPAKGQDLLFEALSAPQWRDRPWKLLIYGDGDMGDSLRWLAEKLGISDRVVFAGFASVRDIWAANHVLLMPSRFEGLPLALVEAMLCARPVVATDVAGHAEIIDDGITGFLADAPTADALVTALERFWTNRDAAERMGLAGARKIRELLPTNPARVFADKLQSLAGPPVGDQ